MIPGLPVLLRYALILLQSPGFCYDEIVWTRATTRAAGRIAARQGRIVAHQGRAFARHVVPAVVNPARSLWNQFIGFVFLCFGGTFAFKTGRLFLDYRKAPSPDPLRDIIVLAVSSLCTLVMLWFSLTSFLRARRFSRL